MIISKEWKLMIEICRHRLGSPSIDFKHEDVNWEAFYQLAEIHRIIPTVYEVIQPNRNRIDIPSDVFNRLHEYYLMITHHNLILTGEMLRLDQLLKKAKIEYIPYKGIILSHLIYENISSRQTADIDILISLKKLESIKSLLKSYDYEIPIVYNKRLEKKRLFLNCEFSMYKKIENRKISIDTHWKMANPMLQFDIDYESLIPYLEKKKFKSTEIDLMSSEALYITTCIHHVGKEKLLHLKQLLDLAMILKSQKENLDWDLLIELAEKWKVKNMVLYSIAMIEHVLDVEILENEQGYEGFKKTLYFKNHFTELYNSQGKMPASILDDFKNGIKLQLALRDNLWTKAKVIYYHTLTLLTPNASDFEDPFNITTSQWFMAYIQKPFRLFKSHF